MNNNYAKQKAIREQIKVYKQAHPKEFAAMVAKVQAEQVAKVEAKTEAEKWASERLELLRKGNYNYALRHALVRTDMPVVEKIEKIEGMLGFRQWDLNDTGFLGSTNRADHVWKAVTIADKLPSTVNTSGLYCIGLGARGMTSVGGYFGACCGLIELRGHCEIHGQEGIVRAEWAKILAIFITQCSESMYLAIPRLVYNYPTVPLFITTRELAAKYLLRVAMWQETGDSSFLYK